MRAQRFWAYILKLSYLDMKYKGAQPEQYIVKPTVEQFEKYQEAANGLIRYITMATETDDDFALTRYCAEHGIVVSIGHSAATIEEAVRAFAHGARSMTHVYNGMTPFNHRANGLGRCGIHDQEYVRRDHLRRQSLHSGGSAPVL